MRNWIAFVGFCMMWGSVVAGTDSLTVDSVKGEQSFSSTYFEDTPWSDQLDSLYTKELLSRSKFIDNVECLNVHNFPEDSIPVWADSIIANRLAALDAQTPLKLDHNEITHKFILFYANKRRYLVSRVLGLQHQYYPLFEEELEKEGLPLELKHLAVVESALTPDIRSRAGAVGLWQFMYRTGKHFGLNINSYVDERMDPVASTKTAVQYLKYLHNLYDDWHLALAAYNAGPGNVNKAIRRSGGKKTYWGVYPYLPRETRGYVPAFIAVNYIMHHAADHNIYPRTPRFQSAELDTVQVNQHVSFEQISEVSCISLEDINYLNPQFKTGIVPKNPKTNTFYSLILPRNDVGKFIALEKDIYEYKLPSELNFDQSESGEQLIAKKKKVRHRVRNGESIGLIAQKYGVTTSEVRDWNGLRRRSVIHPGQRLTIFTSKKSRKSRSAIASNKTTKKNGYIYHTIRNGDTLWDIANKYKGVSVTSIRRLNNLRKNHVLKPGDKIKIKST